MALVPHFKDGSDTVSLPASKQYEHAARDFEASKASHAAVFLAVIHETTLASDCRRRVVAWTCATSLSSLQNSDQLGQGPLHRDENKYRKPTFRGQRRLTGTADSLRRRMWLWAGHVSLFARPRDSQPETWTTKQFHLLLKLSFRGQMNVVDAKRSQRHKM